MLLSEHEIEHMGRLSKLIMKHREMCLRIFMTICKMELVFEKSNISKFARNLPEKDKEFHIPARVHSK